MSLLKKVVAGCFLLCLLVQCADAKNILKNADFKRMGAGNIPRRWKTQVAEGCELKFATGTMTMTVPQGAKPSRIFQEYLSVERDKPMEFAARITGDGVFRIFVDWPGSPRKPVNAQWQDFTENWRAINSYKDDYLDYGFEYTTPTAENQPPRLVIEVKSGTLTFANLVSKVSAPPAALGKQWHIAGASRFVKELGTTVVSLGFYNFNEPSAWLDGVTVQPNTWYELTFDAKPGVKTTHRGGYRNYKVGVKFSQEAEARYSTWRVMTTDGYTRQSYRFKTPPAATTAHIYFGTTTNCLVKNLSLKEYRPAPLENATLRLTSPIHRNSIYHSLPVKAVSGTVTDVDGTIGSGTAELALNGKKVASAPLKKLKDQEFGFTFDADSLADGDYLLTVTLTGKNGAAQRTLTDTIRKLPPAPMEVVVGQDKRIYINGKVFIPIGCNGLVRNSGHEERLYAAAHGLNMIVNSPIKAEDEMLKFLDEMHKYGFRIIAMSYFSVTDNAFDNWVAHLKECLTPKVLQHPALIGFNLVDEPYESGFPPEILNRCYDALKKLAPYHLVWVNCGPPGTIDDQRAFMDACDMTGVDIYPVGGPWHSSLPDKSQTCVEKYARRMVEVSEDRKAILMYLQGYSWGEDSESIVVKNPKYPTPDDLRFMTYTSFFGQAAGVSYYTLWGVTRTAFYDDVFRFTKELHAMTPLLVEGKVVADKVDSQNIRTRIVSHGGKEFIFALNMSPTAKNNVIVTVPFPDGTLKVIHEERTLNVKNRQVQDNFGPYGVHVYGVASLPAAAPLPTWTAKPGLSPWRLRQEQNLKERRGIPYDGKANWIWCGGESLKNPGSKVWLGKWIDVQKEVKKAQVMAVADDMAKLYLDGLQIGAVNTWVKLQSMDITKDLSRKGRHLLTAFAQDGRILPCGFLAEIHIEYADGTKELYVTDGSWLASDADESQVRFDPTRTAKWQNAVIVAPYGGGAWKKGVKMPSSVK